MKTKIKLSVAFSLLFIVIFFVGFKAINDNDKYFLIVKNLDIFTTLYKEVNSHYVEDINPNELIQTGIDAMLKSLDPYTTYIPEDDIEDYMTMTTGEYAGIGALIDIKDNVTTIVHTYKDFPADRSGLKIGDQILSINGISLSKKSDDDINTLIKGEVNSSINLQVKRYGVKEPFTITLKREKITIKNVPYFGMVNEDIAYIKLEDFTTNAGQEVADALDKLKEKGAKKVILDLRGNPGGLLNEAINVSNVFVEKDVEVVSTRGKLESWTNVYKTKNEPVDLEIPIAVLVDHNSASASEIVSGVIQDFDRGVLIGRKTYGKGLVQQTRPLSYNAQLKVTTAKYYIPSGRCIQAIQYNHDGTKKTIPDSLKSKFNTRNGREVYDGGGIDPDIVVTRNSLSPITISLLKNNLIFDFATEYHFKNKSISPARDFDISDADYNSFVSWLSDKDYTYTTEFEKSLEDLIQKSKVEKYFDDLKTQIDLLKKAIVSRKKNDLISFKDEIKLLLGQEIVNRYYLQEGVKEFMFNKDEDILVAKDLLNNPQKYAQILTKQ